MMGMRAVRMWVVAMRVVAMRAVTMRAVRVCWDYATRRCNGKSVFTGPRL